MSNWLPKIVYFAALLVVAFQIIQVGKTIYVDPITQAEKALDNPNN